MCLNSYFSWTCPKYPFPFKNKNRKFYIIHFNYLINEPKDEEKREDEVEGMDLNISGLAMSLGSGSDSDGEFYGFGKPSLGTDWAYYT